MKCILIMFDIVQYSGEVMTISPKDVLNKNKNLNKRVDVNKINLDNISIDDLRYNGKNYDEYIKSF